MSCITVEQILASSSRSTWLYCPVKRNWYGAFHKTDCIFPRRGLMASAPQSPLHVQEMDGSLPDNLSQKMDRLKVKVQLLLAPLASSVISFSCFCSQSSIDFLFTCSRLFLILLPACLNKTSSLVSFSLSFSLNDSSLYVIFFCSSFISVSL